MRYLLFGASITFGETDYINGGWAGHLSKHLDAQEGHRVVHNLAISGNTSADVLNRIKFETKSRLRNKPKSEWTTIISVGTNDSRLDNDNENISLEDFKQNLQKIIDIAKNLTGDVIIVGLSKVDEETCNPFKGKHIFLNERLKLYNSVLKEVSEEKNSKFIDVFDKYDPKNTDDGLHPNTKGHEEMFKLIRQHFE